MQYNLKLAYSSNKMLRVFVALALLYVTLEFIGSTLAPPVYSISTEEILPANLEDSWQALTDFAAYPEWNPYLPSVKGEFEVGEEVALTLVTASSSGPRESRAKFSEIEPLKQFSWKGGVAIPGVFSTRHVFALEKIDEESTRLVHFEEFRGLAVALDSSGREAEIKNNMEAFSGMNRALRNRLGASLTD